ncbi:MAG: RNA methyltransferase, partial [Dolichospermum sp.]
MIIVLVEPAGALNVGSVARVMKNFGLSKLILVNPQSDRSCFDAIKMAVHGKDILASAVIVDTLPAALQGCVRAIATIGRDYSGEIPLENPRTALPWLLETPKQPVALIFGREDRGLSNEELNYAHKLVFIPTSPEYPSLNLAAAVAICCYELSQSSSLFIDDNKSIEEIAPLDAVEA